MQFVANHEPALRARRLDRLGSGSAPASPPGLYASSYSIPSAIASIRTLSLSPRSLARVLGTSDGGVPRRMLPTGARAPRRSRVGPRFARAVAIAYRKTRPARKAAVGTLGLEVAGCSRIAKWW